MPLCFYVRLSEGWLWPNWFFFTKFVLLVCERGLWWNRTWGIKGMQLFVSSYQFLGKIVTPKNERVATYFSRYFVKRKSALLFFVVKKYASCWYTDSWNVEKWLYFSLYFKFGNFKITHVVTTCYEPCGISTWQLKKNWYQHTFYCFMTTAH